MSKGSRVSVRREVLAWDRPLLARAVAWLAAGWSGSGPLDLSDTLLVVPTRQSGRRLRAALAEHAARQQQAVLPPRVVLPEQVLDLAAPAGPKSAGRAELLVAWVHVLQNARLDDFRAVFPVDPARREFARTLPLAEDFVRVQESLAEAGLRFADVVRRAGEAFLERERWEQMGDLEDELDRILAKGGVLAPTAAVQAAVEAPSPPPLGTGRVVMLAVPDLRVTVAKVLEAWSPRVEVVVLPYCAPGEVDRFDDWGRPLPEAWVEAPVDLTDFEGRVHGVADTTAEAAEVARWAGAYAMRPGLVALGCADAELEPLLASELKAVGLRPFRPEGEAFSQHSLPGLLERLLGAARDERWEAWASLARRAEILDWLARGESAPAPARFLAGLDALLTEHLPPSVGEAARHAGRAEMRLRFPGLADAIARLVELVEPLKAGPFPAVWNTALARLYRGRRFDRGSAPGRAFLDTAEAWREQADAVGAVAPLGLSPLDQAEFALRLLAARRRYDDKPEGAIEIDGWLELLFRDEPHLIVAGCNDGSLPEAITGHAFLPDSLRGRLGLKTNAQRLARDAWQLAALAASRAAQGRLDLWLAKTSIAGDPLRPSRLLFLCPETELTRRVRHLFREAPPLEAKVGWRRGWQLHPPPPGPVEMIRVTGFRDYLACPFRFYLKHGLRMEPMEPDKRELDPADFGTLLHRVLERLGRDPDWRDCVDERRLAEGFGAELDRAVEARFGRELSVPLLVQVESARQRLAHAARVQAAERAAGWVIRHVEWRFPTGGLKLGGLAVAGTIDRVEQHEATGAWRVLDYKTAETAVTPAEAHLRSARRAEPPGLLLEARFDGGKRPRVWADLQLPLYRWAVLETLGATDAAIGYFNLPKAVSQTAVTPWLDFDVALQDGAMRCAAAVAKAVGARRFWPPAEDVRPDPYAELFHEGAAESVAWR